MSSTGIIFKKREDERYEGFQEYERLDSLIHDIQLAAERAGLMVNIDPKTSESLGKGLYTTGNIANTYEDIPEAQQWVMSIHSDDDWGFFEYTDIREEEGMIRAVFIDNAPDFAEILLDFLFEYFKLNPNDYFWLDGYKWHFTYEDIKRLKQDAFDPIWCCKDPHADSSNA